MLEQISVMQSTQAMTGARQAQGAAQLVQGDSFLDSGCVPFASVLQNAQDAQEIQEASYICCQELRSSAALSETSDDAADSPDCASGSAGPKLDPSSRNARSKTAGKADSSKGLTAAMRQPDSGEVSDDRDLGDAEDGPDGPDDPDDLGSDTMLQFQAMQGMYIPQPCLGEDEATGMPRELQELPGVSSIEANKANGVGQAWNQSAGTAGDTDSEPSVLSAPRVRTAPAASTVLTAPAASVASATPTAQTVMLVPSTSSTAQVLPSTGSNDGVDMLQDADALGESDEPDAPDELSPSDVSDMYAAKATRATRSAGAAASRSAVDATGKMPSETPIPESQISAIGATHSALAGSQTGAAEGKGIASARTSAVDDVEPTILEPVLDPAADSAPSAAVHPNAGVMTKEGPLLFDGQSVRVVRTDDSPVAFGRVGAWTGVYGDSLAAEVRQPAASSHGMNVQRAAKQQPPKGQSGPSGIRTVSAPLADAKQFFVGARSMEARQRAVDGEQGLEPYPPSVQDAEPPTELRDVRGQALQLDGTGQTGEIGQEDQVGRIGQVDQLDSVSQAIGAKAWAKEDLQLAVDQTLSMSASESAFAPASAREHAQESRGRRLGVELEMTKAARLNAGGLREELGGETEDVLGGHDILENVAVYMPRVDHPEATEQRPVESGSMVGAPRTVAPIGSGAKAEAEEVLPSVSASPDENAGSEDEVTARSAYIPLHDEPEAKAHRSYGMRMGDRKLVADLARDTAQTAAVIGASDKPDAPVRGGEAAAQHEKGNDGDGRSFPEADAQREEPIRSVSSEERRDEFPAVREQAGILRPIINEDGIDFSVKDAELDPGVRQLASEAAAQAQRGGGVFRARLGKGELGEIEVHVRVAGGTCTATIRAADPEVRAALEGKRAELEAALMERGIKLDGLAVAVGHVREGSAWFGGSSEKDGFRGSWFQGGQDGQMAQEGLGLGGFGFEQGQSGRRGYDGGMFYPDDYGANGHGRNGRQAQTSAQSRADDSSLASASVSAVRTRMFSWVGEGGRRIDYLA